jgi:hypothetical protein
LKPLSNPMHLVHVPSRIGTHNGCLIFIPIIVIIKLMQVTVEKKLDKRIAHASKTLGVDKKNLVERALLFYLDSVRKSVDLKHELDAWDQLSDDAYTAVDHEKR